MFCATGVSLRQFHTRRGKYVPAWRGFDKGVEPILSCLCADASLSLQCVSYLLLCGFVVIYSVISTDNLLGLDAC